MKRVQILFGAAKTAFSTDTIQNLFEDSCTPWYARKFYSRLPSIAIYSHMGDEGVWSPYSLITHMQIGMPYGCSPNIVKTNFPLNDVRHFPFSKEPSSSGTGGSLDFSQLTSNDKYHFNVAHLLPSSCLHHI